MNKDDENIEERIDRIKLKRSYHIKVPGRAEKLKTREERLRKKAKKLAQNDVIYPGDDDAVEKLETRIAQLQRLQKLYSDANKIAMTKQINTGAKLQLLQEILGMEKEEAISILEPNEDGKLGYSRKFTRNNSVKLWNHRKQLERVIKLKAGEYKTYLVNGIPVEEIPPKDVFRITFPKDPGKEITTKLHSAGSYFSKQFSSWQCHFNPVIIERGKKILEELSFN